MDIEKHFREKSKMSILNSLIVPKNVKGDPLGFIDIHSVEKYLKIEAELFDAIKKFSKKVSLVPRKIEVIAKIAKGGNLSMLSKFWTLFLFFFCFGRGYDVSSMFSTFKLLKK